ncbi:MAG: hypothetical protein WB930_10140 [Syntrophobacteraceae bacterium]
MRPQKTRRSLALIVAACVFITIISACLINTCRYSPRLALGYNLLSDGEDQGAQQCCEQLLRLLNTALTSWFSIAFSIEQLTGTHPVSALLLPFSPRFDLLVRGPPHTTHS